MELCTRWWRPIPSRTGNSELLVSIESHLGKWFIFFRSFPIILFIFSGRVFCSFLPLRSSSLFPPIHFFFPLSLLCDHNPKCTSHFCVFVFFQKFEKFQSKIYINLKNLKFRQFIVVSLLGTGTESQTMVQGKRKSSCPKTWLCLHYLKAASMRLLSESKCPLSCTKSTFRNAQSLIGNFRTVKTVGRSGTPKLADVPKPKYTSHIHCYLHFRGHNSYMRTVTVGRCNDDGIFSLNYSRQKVQRLHDRQNYAISKNRRSLFEHRLDHDIQPKRKWPPYGVTDCKRNFCCNQEVSKV